MSWLKKQIKNEWYEFLSPIIKSKTFKKNFAQVVNEYARTKCYPPQDKIFKAFELCKFEDLKVILVGNGPANDGSSTGLAFDQGSYTPLMNVMHTGYCKEYPGSFNTKFMDGELSHWAKQGILMLNTSLTVQKGKTGSHAGMWIYFIDKLFKKLNEIDKPLLFITWGIDATTIADKEIKKHRIISAYHPALYLKDASKWNPSGSFIETEKWVKENYNEQLNW
jgi:uracil-DNA glycosylase